MYLLKIVEQKYLKVLLLLPVCLVHQAKFKYRVNSYSSLDVAHYLSEIWSSHYNLKTNAQEPPRWTKQR